LGEKLPSTPIPIYRRVFVIKRERAINEKRAPKLPLTISATYLAFCFVVVEVVELAAIVVRVEVEITVVVEEGVVLRRGPLIPSPSGGEEYCGVGAPPSVPILHQQFGAHLVEGLTATRYLRSRRGQVMQQWWLALARERIPGPFGVEQGKEAKCPYFTYLFCKMLLRSKLEDENFILNPSSTKTTTYLFAITICWTILLCISILSPG
jgi:hypothetical protein